MLPVAAYDHSKGVSHMKVIHHYTNNNSTDLLQRKTALHRRCLLLLQARMDRPAPSGTRKTG